MAQVFLSYARGDVGRAKPLALAIERSGYSVWWDRDLEGGAEYSLEIDDALKAADVVIVLWSKESVGSAWVRDEAAAGRDSGRLVPVRLDGCEPPLGFRQYQTIDLSRWNGRGDSAGLRTLKRAIAAKVGRGSTAASPLPEIGQRRLGLPRWAIPLAAVFLLVAAALGYVWFSQSSADGVPTIAIVRAPGGGDPARSEALARSIAVEVGATQSTASSTFDLREATGGDPGDVDYLVQVAASPSGATTSADLSLLASAGREILWTSHFEKSRAEEADLRPQAAARLHAVLGCLVEANNASGKPLDLSTLKLFLRACERFADAIGGLPDEVQLSLLRQVVNRAPRFAPAIAHLALAQSNAARPEQARALIARAKALDPSLAKIYIAQSEMIPREKWRQRQAPLRDGLRVNPDAASLHSSMAFELNQVGLRNDGIVSARRAVELDPSSPAHRATLIQVLTYNGSLAEAEAELRKAEKIWPTSTTIRDMRWAYDLRVGDPVRAMQTLNKDESVGSYIYTGTRMPEWASLKAFLEARIDPTPANIEKAIEAHRAKVRLEPHLAGTMLLALAIFDRVDEAYAVMSHPVTLEALPSNTNLLFRSYFKSIRQDPRFMPLAARIGLVRYWSETGRWPDFCFEPDLPYDCKREAAKLKAAGKVR